MKKSAFDASTFDAMKRKIQKLKQFEIKVRFGGDTSHSENLVWNRFFDLHEPARGKSKYSLLSLASMAADEYQAAVSEYFEALYDRLYKENGIIHLSENYDSEILAKLGLPPYADESDIRKKFHELAKQYHPDTGGDAEKFIELLRDYHTLIKK